MKIAMQPAFLFKALAFWWKMSWFFSGFLVHCEKGNLLITFWTWLSSQETYRLLSYWSLYWPIKSLLLTVALWGLYRTCQKYGSKVLHNIWVELIFFKTLWICVSHSVKDLSVSFKREKLIWNEHATNPWCLMKWSIDNCAGQCPVTQKQTG